MLHKKYLSKILVVAVLSLVVILFKVSLFQVANAADNNFANGITVDSAGDGADDTVGDGICDDGAGNCTLRAAIQEANSAAGAQTISFNIAPLDGSVKVIQPTTMLPLISSEIHIDGYSQDDAEPNTAPAPEPLNSIIRIQIDGSSLSADEDLLRTDSSSDNSSFSGLSLVDAPSVAISLDSTTGIDITGNFIGLLPDGMTAAGNGGNSPSAVPANQSASIRITASSAVNIGGLLPAERNVVSSSFGYGINSFFTTSNVSVYGNYFGLAKDGETIRGNVLSGVGFYDSSFNIRVGSSQPGGMNVVAGSYEGITFGGVLDSFIVGNRVGTNWAGTSAKPNGTGVSLAKASDVLQGYRNTVGGITAGDRNIISGNSTVGVSVGGDNDTTILGNYIGLQPDGTTALANGQIGIFFQSGDGNTVGGLSSNARNVIANNGMVNILMLGTSGVASAITDNKVIGNYIGTNKDGTPQDSGFAGIVIQYNVADNIVGGTEAGAGNLIYSAGTPIQLMSTTGLPKLNRNSILGNTVLGPASTIGIELCNDGLGAFSCDTGVGHTPNDAGDIDLGPNNYMNTPVITGVAQVGNQITFTYDLDAADAPGGQYRVEFFHNDAADTDGFGLGAVMLGGSTSATGSGLTATYTLPDNTDITSKIFSATTTAIDNTATSGFGSTSEFGTVSNDLVVSYVAAAPSSLTLASTGQNVLKWGGIASLLLVAAGFALVARSRQQI